MAKKTNLADLPENQLDALKEVFKIIDEQGELGVVDRKTVEETIQTMLDDDRLMAICRAYMDYKYPDFTGKAQSKRTQEDILEFGADLDEDDEDEEDKEHDSMFNRLLNAFIRGKAIEDETDDSDSDAGSGYDLLCELSDNPTEYLVLESFKEIKPIPESYVHVDLVIPDIIEKDELRVEVTALRGAGVMHGWFDKTSIPLYRDGNHLHLKPALLSDLFGKDYKLDSDEEDLLVMTLYKNEKWLYSRKIPIKGPWPPKAKPFESCTNTTNTYPDIPGQMALINELPGWENFKARMNEMVSRCSIGALRKEAGLASNRPTLHTVIMGNPGTGKSSCVPYMTSLYKALGLLDTDDIHTTRVSMLATSNVNGEYERMISEIINAQGGTLVFENAHELYRTDKSNNYDTEQRIIRALVDALEDDKTYPRWMLVLEGEPDGLESVLASNPDLKKHLGQPIYMEDFKPEELFRMVDECCNSRDLKLSPKARTKLEMYILHKYNHRGAGFQNAWLVQELFDEHIIPAMYNRLQAFSNPTPEDLQTVEAADIPMISIATGKEMEALDELVGLGTIKTKVKDYLNAVNLAGRRMERGLPTNMPRLHMAFLGNPGTGKTTVAEIIGKVFASWGILSGGRVIRTERSQLVGQWIGETEHKMRNLLDRARGNILFIDEAYQLVEGANDRKDYGRIVMDSLLTELGKDNQDMVVILAGYTAPMKRLLESNEGIESRFPNVFNFEDYTTDELVEIGKLMIKKQGFTLTPGAEANMRTIIEAEAEKPSPRFGNGRFVSNLLQNEVLATLGARTAKLDNPTKEDLSTILPEDVVIGKAQKDVIFDDVAIDAALARLDALAGLTGVKAAIHNFVKSARYLHSIGEPYVGKGLLSWRFIGKSGTGKSTVAEIMASILKGMRLIANSHITQVKGERILGAYDESKAVLEEAVKKSCNGLIFIDVDDSKFNDDRARYTRIVEQLLLKLKEMTVEAGGECALILAELDAPNVNVAEQLSDAGIYEFDHTLIFKDFTPDELYDILCDCLKKFEITFTPEAEKHMRSYITTLRSSINANARTMKLMARTIHQQVILREAGLIRRPKSHQVQLGDIETFKWNSKKGKIGY
ncbi:MAG: AAA family ATPase [Bacteroidales bacterium]|nr:AAA family ATPase [Bacteroidales bacterium]